MYKTFKEFLSEISQNVSFNADKEKPSEIMAKARKAARTAAASPERWQKERQENIKDRQKDIAASEGDPLEQEKLKVAKEEERTAKRKMTLAKKERHIQKATGIEKEKPEVGEIV